MTVKELCSELEEYDDNANVFVKTRDTWIGIEIVRVDKVECETTINGSLIPVLYTVKQKGRD